MIVCGIHRCKAKASKHFIVDAFQFYDVKRHTTKHINEYENGIGRTNFVRDLEKNCLMTTMEALLAYVIVKRAIKSFYHNTPEHGLRNAVAEALHIKEQEQIWIHAAKRIIQIFKTYKHEFFRANNNYRNQIINIFKSLHDRMKSRADPVIVDDCHVTGCGKKRVIIKTKSSQENSNKINKGATYERPLSRDQQKKIFVLKSCHSLPNPCPVLCNNRKEQQTSLTDMKFKAKTICNKTDRKLQFCKQCKCPQILCDCKIQQNTGLLAIDCSQGPFQCQWVHTNKRRKSDLCIEKPEQHICPVDCQLAYVPSGYKLHYESMDMDEMYESSDNDDKVERITTSKLKSHRNRESCIRKVIRHNSLIKSLC